MNDVVGITSRFDNTLPFHPGVNSYAAFQVFAFTTTVDPVGCACGTKILHKGAVITHHDNNGVFGNAKFVHFFDNRSNPLVDLNKAVGNSSTIEGFELRSVVKNKYKMHLPAPGENPIGAAIFDLYRDPREERPIDSIKYGPWAGGQFVGMT